MSDLTKASKKRKGFKAPHTFIILLTLIFVVICLSYVIPAGEFDRVQDPASGRTVVVPGSYHQIESTPFRFVHFPGVTYRAMVDAADIMIFILMMGGAFEIVISSGALMALSCKVAKVCKNGREFLVIPFFMVLFSIFGTTMGMSSEVMIFVPIGIAIATSVGYDRVTGAAMIAMGAACGFSAGVYNAFSVGVAQSIAEVQVFSGAWLRIFLLIALVTVTTLYIIRYANRVKADPSKSIIYGIDDEYDHSQTMEEVEMTPKHVAVLLTVLAGFTVLIIGVNKFDFWYEEMAATFLVMSVICGFFAGYGPSKIASTFAAGAKGITGGAIIVGLSRGIQVVMNDAQIIDTIVNAVATAVQALPKPAQILGMYTAQNLINVVITSGSGQAVVTMPIMTPISDLIGMSRQTAVLAFQLGDGFSNSILPTSSATMGFLSVAKIPYEKWLKFMIPLFGIWFVVGAIFMIIASVSGYA